MYSLVRLQPKLVTRSCSSTKLMTRSCSSKSQITSTAMPEIENMCPGVSSHQELHRFSVEQPDLFWSTLARSRLSWNKDFHTGMDCDFRQGKFDWFLGGELNVTVNCVDRWAALHPDRVALIWEKDEPGQEERVTYSQLLDL